MERDVGFEAATQPWRLRSIDVLFPCGSQSISVILDRTEYFG